LRSTIWSGEFKAIAPDAEAQVHIALELDDRDPWACLAQGMLYQRLSRFDEALRTWRRALELNPNFALAHAVLSLALVRKRAFDAAIDSAERAIRLSPIDRLVSTYAMFRIALAHFGAERYDEAIMSARKLVERNREEMRAHMLLTASLALNNNREAAAAAGAALLGVRPGFSVRWARENLPWSGEFGTRLQEGLRMAGVPET
jgi:adenylate cyclase